MIVDMFPQTLDIHNDVSGHGKHGGGIEMANKIVRDIIHAKGIDIGIYTKDFENEYISLTDIAKYRNDNNPRFVIQNWMRNRNTVEFFAVWEELHNPNFNRVQFEAVRRFVNRIQEGFLYVRNPMNG